MKQEISKSSDSLPSRREGRPMKMRILMVMIGIVANLISRQAPAPTPPESYQLIVAKNEANPIDPKMAEWFQAYAENVTPFEKTDAEFSDFVKGQDQVTKALLSARYVRLKNKKGTKEGADTLKEVSQVALSQDAAVKDHVFYPYLLEEAMRYETGDSATKLQEAMRSIGEKSCAQRKSLIRDIEITEPMTVQAARDFMTRIDSFRSRNFRSDAVRTLLHNINKENHEELAPDLYPLIKPYSRLVSDYPWVKEMAGVSEEKAQEKSEPTLSYEKAGELGLAGKQCDAAFNKLKEAVNKSEKRRSHLKVAETSAAKVDTCFKRKSVQNRLKYWREVQTLFGQAFGFSGEEVALRRQGQILWGDDRFDDARQIFNAILTGAREKKLEMVEGRTLYTLARIEENASNFPEAIKFYESFFNKFPDTEYTEQTLMSLVLLYYLQNKPDKALTFADRMVADESVKDIDERSTSGLSFGLYWSGRLNYELGNAPKAEEMWRRVASEFYSSFYGAIGHYTLEKLVDKPLVLQPMHAAPFAAEELYKVYGKDERKIVDRSLALLKLGLRDEASCEIIELSEGNKDYKKDYLKSLLLFAAGDWFEAIKIYGNLPRSFRNALPAGSERILFPKAYAEPVLKYSDKLGVDSDYVLAIIRQESVFNPRARSPVGAQGLMQIMPQTASMEAKRMRNDYVDKMFKQSILRGTREKKIFDPETNLAIGVQHVHNLMNQYKSPIFVLTAYNASPKATERWRKNIPTEDTLVFIEQIPYKETRAYVKLVLRNYFYYKRWYSSPSEKLRHLEFITMKMDKKGKPTGSPAADSKPTDVPL